MTKAAVVKAARVFETWSTRVAVALAAVSAATMLAMCASIVIGIVTRKAGHPTLWTEPVTIALVTWCTLLGFAYTERDRKHIAVGLLVDHLPLRLATWLGVVTDLVSLACVGLFAAAGEQSVAVTYASAIATVDPVHIPLWLLELPVPVGFGGLGVLMVRRMVLSARDPSVYRVEQVRDAL